MFDDDFNGPSMSSDYAGYGSYDTPKENPIKKFLPFIIVGIILLIIGFFVMNHFNSQKKVSFSIQELGGGVVGDASLTIRSQGEIVYGPELGSNHTITLFTGDYTYSVSSITHISKQNIPFTVDNETKEEPITLMRDISLDLEVVQPVTKIFSGNEVIGKIIISNPSSDLKNQEITWSDSKKVLEIVLNPNKVNLDQGGAKTIDYTIKVANKQLKESVETQIVFSIKGTNIKTSAVNVNVSPIVSDADFVESDSSREKNKLITENKLVAGEEKEIQITLENKNKTVDVENIDIKIVPDIEYENSDWMLSLTNNGSINKIAKKTKEPFRLRITAPISADIGDKFKGWLVVSADNIEREKEYQLNFEVKTKKETKLELSATNFTINCEPYCTGLNTILKNLTLNNKGTTTIQDIVIELDADKSPVCEDWFEINVPRINSIAPKGKEKIDIDITPLFITETKNTICYLKFTYTDPVTESRENLDIPLVIKTTYKDPKK